MNFYGHTPFLHYPMSTQTMYTNHGHPHEETISDQKPDTAEPLNPVTRTHPTVQNCSHRTPPAGLARGKSPHKTMILDTLPRHIGRECAAITAEAIKL